MGIYSLFFLSHLRCLLLARFNPEPKQTNLWEFPVALPKNPRLSLRRGQRVKRRRRVSLEAGPSSPAWPQKTACGGSGPTCGGCRTLRTTCGRSTGPTPSSGGSTLTPARTRTTTPGCTAGGWVARRFPRVRLFEELDSQETQNFP